MAKQKADGVRPETESLQSGPAQGESTDAKSGDKPVVVEDAKGADGKKKAPRVCATGKDGRMKALLKEGFSNFGAAPKDAADGEDAPESKSGKVKQRFEDMLKLGHSYLDLLKVKEGTGFSDVDQDDFQYMSEVDAALLRRGHPSAYLISYVVAAIFVLLLLWANFAVLDEVTRGQGKVVPSQRVQEIQNLEGGILKEILVTEGQIVDKGDLLVRIDNELAESQYRDAQHKLLESLAVVACLEADLMGEEPVIPDEVLLADPELAQEQILRYEAKKDQREAEVKILQTQLEQKEQETQELQARKSQLEQSLALSVEQLNIARPLVKQEIFPKLDYLELKNTVVKLRGDLEAVRLGIPRLEKAADEIRETIERTRAVFRAQMLDELSARKSEAQTLHQTLSAGEDKVVRTELRSPVRGTVKRIILNTIGGVVRPGQSVLEIVPIDESLVIETKVRPSDIAFLRPNQKAIVKISAYDFSIFGGLEGYVTNISADTIENERGETFYLVKVRTKGNTILYKNEELPIITGMTAQVDILTGQKTVMEYLLKPLMKAKQNALRER